MKKENMRDTLSWKSLRKTCLRMKFVLLFLLASVAQLSAGVYGQVGKVTLQMEDATFEEVMRALEGMTGYSFVYQDSEVAGVKNLDLNYTDTEIREVLDACLAGTGLSYRLVDDVIVIRAGVKVAADTLKGQNLKGTVQDEKKNPLPGVTISVKGTTIGFVTDMDGKFDIDLPQRDSLELIFSFVGYKAEHVKVRPDMKTLDVVMKEDVVNIDEVVVTGIFNKPKESFTGAVTAVSKEDLKKNFSRNLLQTLSNIDPSFRILENNEMGSDPNTLPEIQLRGASTFSNVNDLQLATRAELNTPLFILDGFEVDLEQVMDLNNEDIESITVLKDASATALYGARGANGVVVITSLVPQAGKLKISYRGTVKLEIPDLNSYDLLSAKEKLDLEEKLGIWDDELYDEVHKELREKVDAGFDFDWLGYPTRTGVGQTHSLNFTGGSENWRFNASLYYDETIGVMKGSDRKNFSGSLGLSYQTDKLIVGENLTIGTNNNASSPYGDFSSYANMNPYWEPTDEDGEPVVIFVHPLQTTVTMTNNPAYDYLVGSWNKTRYTSVRSSTQVRYNFTESFYLSGLIGLSRIFNQADNFVPPSHVQFAGKELDQKGNFGRMETETNKWNVRVGLNYAKTFKDKHMVTLSAAGEMEESKEERISWAATGFTTDNIDFPTMALGYGDETYPNGSESTTRRISLIFGGNYYYDMRYFVDVNVNANGASSYGEDSRWGSFWSVGAGWIMSNEDFFIEHVPYIQWLKMNVSYGVTGNAGFSPDNAMMVYKLNTQQDYLNNFGAYMDTFGNPELKWQNTYQWNFGMELKTWNERLELGFNYYRKMTTNTVSDVYLPISHGFSTYKANIGSILNRGWDAKLTLDLYRNLDRGFTWSITSSFNANKNIVHELSEGFLYTLTHGTTNMASQNNVLTYREGHSMSAIYGLRTVGVDPQTGQRLFLDKDGNVTFRQDPEDMVYLGDYQPKVNGNISTTLSYKGLMLTIGFNMRMGAKQYNSTLANKVENTLLANNLDRRVLDEAWQEPGDVVPYKKITVSSDGSYTNTNVCDAFVQKDNVFQCTNINITYNFSDNVLKKLHLKGLSVNANLSDIFYISTIKRERGTSYPFSRNPNFSLNISF